MSEFKELEQNFNKRGNKVIAHCKICRRPIPFKYPVPVTVNPMLSYFNNDPVCLCGDEKHLQYYIDHSYGIRLISTNLKTLKLSTKYYYLFALSAILVLFLMLELVLGLQNDNIILVSMTTPFLGLGVFFCLIYGLLIMRLFFMYSRYLPPPAQKGDIYEKFYLLAKGIPIDVLDNNGMTGHTPINIPNQDQNVNIFQRMMQNSVTEQSRTHEINQDSLNELKGLFEISNKVKINDICDLLNIDRTTFIRNLIKWKNQLTGFKIEGDEIAIENREDTSKLINLLDEQFKQWQDDKFQKN